MLVSLVGSNSFGLKRRLDELARAFVAEHGELALEKIDAESASENQILDAVQSLPFLADRKLVVVRGLSGNKLMAEQIEQIIDAISDGTDLIFHEPSIDKRTSFFKVLKNKTQLEEFNELDARSLAAWLVDEVKNRGGELSYADANYLVERLGTNQQMLASELDKLLTYEPKISRISIDLLTELAPQSKVFDLLDAAFSGNKKRALKLYEQQRAQKVEPQLIIGMVAWQLQLIALAKNGSKRTPAQIAADSGMKPYPIEKARGLANRLSSDELKGLVAEALDIDYKSKTTPLDLDEALKTYIVSL
ncbi:DNA polymerase III subunit delta [Candidatus Saccharibacteria bacterium]|nr:DNA polymerase III subunit delta [Candidatus Saccharibacteria bacterium]